MEIDSKVVREDFLEYMATREYSPHYVEGFISYLDRYATMVIREPRDIFSIFARCKAGRKHLNRGLREVFNFHAREGWMVITYVQGGVDIIRG